MRTSIVIIVGIFCWAAALGAEVSKIKDMKEAEKFISAKTLEIEKEKAAAVARAQTEIEQKLTPGYQARMEEVKKKLEEERAKAADLQKKHDEAMRILRSETAAFPATPERWGKPVFEDDFSGADVSDKWSKKNFKDQPFKIEDGMLTGKQKISIAQTFSGKALRIQYDTWTMSKSPCDASVFAEAGNWPMVFGGIGGEGNRLCRIGIGAETVAKSDGAFLVPVKRQRLAVELGEGKIRIEVDGKTVLEYKGEKAPKELKEVTFSLYTFAPGMNFDNVRVYVVK